MKKNIYCDCIGKNIQRYSSGNVWGIVMELFTSAPVSSGKLKFEYKYPCTKCGAGDLSCSPYTPFSFNNLQDEKRFLERLLEEEYNHV